MNKSLLVLMAVIACFGLVGMALQKLEEDIFPTPGGDLKIILRRARVPLSDVRRQGHPR